MTDKDNKQAEQEPSVEQAAPSANPGGVVVSDQETRTLTAMVDELEKTSCMSGDEAVYYCEGLLDGYDIGRAPRYISASAGHGPTPVNEELGISLVQNALAKIHARYAEAEGEDDAS